MLRIYVLDLTNCPYLDEPKFRRGVGAEAGGDTEQANMSSSGNGRYISNV